MSVLDKISNYSEVLVLEILSEKIKGKTMDEETLADVVCLALNHLPPKYIRYDVDLMFYTSPDERKARYDRAREAVEQAIKYVEENTR